MASGTKKFPTKPTSLFLSRERDNPFNSESMFEFDEADVWNSNHVTSTELNKSIPSSQVSKKHTKVVERSDGAGEIVKSLPVNIPDWSKILREEYRQNTRGENDDDVDEEEGYGESSWLPPHEYLANQLGRRQMASFSVHEGIGRTLKGRDLSRVRDAIWEKIGFED